ncbi:MAG TPA: 2-amino-4-hydroxy-6-hydroxymethyldihydropteridine diphosphokinase [Candidatus Methylacidiphilales bacterium]
MALVPVGIALGSNLGERSTELDAGTAFLQGLSAYGRIRESSRITTVPVDCPPGSESFLNAVAEIEVDSEILPPLELLRQLQAFEISRGRPTEREINSPRPLDMDIIYYGDWTVHDQELVIPHPRAAMRRFVLEPLSHLQPDLILPGQTKTVRQLLEEFSL